MRTTRPSITPHNVDIGADRSSLLLVGTPAGGGHGGTGGPRLVLAAADVSRPARRDIAIGPHPAHVVPSPDGVQAYVSDSHDGTVMVVDLQAGRIVARIPVGDEPHGLRLSPDGMELCVCRLPYGSSCARLHQKRAVSRRISVPGIAQEVFISGRLPVLPHRVSYIGAEARSSRRRCRPCAGSAPGCIKPCDQFNGLRRLAARAEERLLHW